MAISMSDVLRTAKSLTSNMRHRDTVAEGNRRLARSALSRLESNMEPDANNEKMPSGERALTINDPLPDLIQNCPAYRALYEDNQKLYVVVAEQQLTLEMIMAKYRATISASTNAVESFLRTQQCLDKNDAVLGALLHEKGVLLQTMNNAVWADDGADARVAEHSAEVALDNAVLKEVVHASMRFNECFYLSPLVADRSAQTSPVLESRTLISSIDS